jgi:ABC-type dipeptide/oligopeptide/nickel transport system permease subunit
VYAVKRRRIEALTAGVVLAGLLLAAALAPARLPDIRPDLAYVGPLQLLPFGADNRGRPLLDYALQGAAVVALPAVGAALLVMLLGTVGGLLRCAGSERTEVVAHAVRELVGALPRMVVILVVALVVPMQWRSLGALAVAWALLAAPGAMDEAAALAGRLGGARFIEALRAHGFSQLRIWGWHLVALNLRPVLVRQGAETLMQVVFLEIGLSYLALAETQPSFTHPDEMKSWADILYLGYPSVLLDIPTTHALVLGLGLMGLVAVLSVSVTAAARAR